MRGLVSRVTSRDYWKLIPLNSNNVWKTYANFLCERNLRITLLVQSELVENVEEDDEEPVQEDNGLRGVVDERELVLKIVEQMQRDNEADEELVDEDSSDEAATIPVEWNNVYSDKFVVDQEF